MEAKYVKTDDDEKTIDAAFDDAYTQLELYMSDKDLVATLSLRQTLKAAVFVFVGFKGAVQAVAEG